MLLNSTFTLHSSCETVHQGWILNFLHRYYQVSENALSFGITFQYLRSKSHQRLRVNKDAVGWSQYLTEMHQFFLTTICQSAIRWHSAMAFVGLWMWELPVLKQLSHDSECLKMPRSWKIILMICATMCDVFQLDKMDALVMKQIVFRAGFKANISLPELEVCDISSALTLTKCATVKRIWIKGSICTDSSPNNSRVFPAIIRLRWGIQSILGST